MEPEYNVSVTFQENKEYIVKEIIQRCIQLILFNYQEHRDTFYSWFMTNADYDFVYIYQDSFKKQLSRFFTIDTERVLSYYSQNLFYALSSYYDMYRDLTSIEHFMRLFIRKQFEHIDHYQLFMENFS
jgi:hypothetical protein